MPPLILRLYDLQRGGAGALEAAPEEWGLLTLTTQDGTRFEGYGGEGQGELWHWSIYRSTQDMCLCLTLNSPELVSWGRNLEDGTQAEVTLDGVCYPGRVICWSPIDNVWVLYFFPDEGYAEAADSAFPQAVKYVPAPDKWYRDVWYTAWKWELSHTLFLSPGEADRDIFARELADIIDLPPINQVAELPDTQAEYVLELYNAGILTGIDTYGTFHGSGTLTRAEAAAMLARVLEPDLRIEFAPLPLPTDGYTLTYLADGTPDCGVTYPVCALSGSPGGISGILTLEGQLLPWPDGNVPSYGLEQQGAFCLIAPYDLTTEDPWDTTPGLLNADGTWVIPTGIYQYLSVFEEGILAGKGGGSTFHWYLLNYDGQVLQDLGESDTEPSQAYHSPTVHSWNAIQPSRNDYGSRQYYVNSERIPVSAAFDWCGAVGPDGRGFVGLDGKIYRIEFKQ